MSDQPRLCPFCGGAAHHTLGARQIRILDRVQCLTCFAEIEGTYEPESALKKWNAQQTYEDIHGLPFPRPTVLVRWLDGKEAGLVLVEDGTELEDFEADEGWRGYYKEEDVQALHRRVREGMTQAASLERTVARLQALLKLRTEQLAALGG